LQGTAAAFNDITTITTNLKKMKASTFKESSPALVWMASALSFCMLLTLSFSCRKSGIAAASAEDMNYMTRSLEGLLLTGPLTTVTDSDGLALFCNNGKTLIALGGIAAQHLADPGNIKHATLVYSNFGIVVRNCDTGQVWYYIQNDETSRQRFEPFRKAAEKPLVSAITGTFKINIS
jgi:hypothetical protein